MKYCQTDYNYEEEFLTMEASSISTSYYTADITTYPSMVTHWNLPIPDFTNQNQNKPPIDPTVFKEFKKQFEDFITEMKASNEEREKENELLK